MYEEGEDGELEDASGGGASNADGAGPEDQRPPVRSGRGLTVLEHWTATGDKLKDAHDKARCNRDEAIKRIFDQFEALLGQTARAQWDRIVERICVQKDKDPPPPADLSMTNLSKCIR